MPTLEGNGISIPLGSAAWDSWVEHARSFRFESPHASFTARKEQRPGGWYWYAYRRRHGTLHIAYLGKSEELSSERLRTVGAVLERAEDSSAETSHQSRQRSFAAALQIPHTSIITFPTALSGADALPEATPVPTHNLPIQVTSLVGREPAIATATALLRRPEVRLLSMIGTGGIGKTRLAIEVAMELLEDFADGVTFVALAPLRDPTMLLPTIAHTLGLKESGSAPLMDRLHEYLRHKQLLLVLDNFEHLMLAAPVVGELLTACPNLTLLVTSREVLHLRAEQQFSVPPLALPGGKQVANVQSLTAYPALELFLQRARTVKHDFQVHTTNAQALAEICTLLDGLPLAIELAAARIKFLSPQALLARLDHRLHVLTGGARDLPERQQTLRSTIAWSYELLNAEEQRLFRRLSIFVGGCSFEALEAVCHELGDGDGAGHLFERVSSLIDKSLLHTIGQEGEEPRLMMLETIREYGLEVLAATGEQQGTQAAHAHFFLRLAEQAESELKGPNQAVWIERLEQEHNDLRTALEWALEDVSGEQAAERGNIALRLSAALWPFWSMRGHYSEARTFLERTIPRSDEASVSLRVKVLQAGANVTHYYCDYTRATGMAELCLALYQELGNIRGISDCLGLLADCAMLTGMMINAIELAEERVRLIRQVGEPREIADALFALADLLDRRGELARGEALFEESLVLSRKAGDDLGVAANLIVSATGLWFRSPADATPLQTIRHRLQEAQAIVTKLGSRYWIGYCSWLGALIALSEGETARAESLAQASLTIFREIGAQWFVALALYVLGRVEVQRGEMTAARSWYLQSLQLSLELGDKFFTPFYMEGLADVLAAQGELTGAAQVWGAAETLRQEIAVPLHPVDRARYEQAVATARAQLGEQAFDAAWATGGAMTLEQASMVSYQTSSPGPIPAALRAPALTSANDLTAREMEVLCFVAQGLSDEQVAHQLVISRHTVNSHLKAIYGKLGISSRHAATHYALQHHLL
jgi:predicted ATPase/DNA-binding CsgD family transcriptional regulator